MTLKDAEYIFEVHADDGYYKHPYFHGYHENAVGNITQSYKSHIREANRAKVEELFDVDWDNLPNPMVETAYIFEGVEYPVKQHYKIKKIIKDRFNLRRKYLKGSIKSLCTKFNLELEIKKSPKYDNF